VLRHPHKIRLGDHIVIDDNCLLDAKGDTNAGISIGNGVSSGATASCRAERRYRAGDGANIGFNCEVFGGARGDRSRHAAGGARYVIGGDHEWRDASAPVSNRAAMPPACGLGRARGLARARRSSTAW
jgi:hypothetical protein